MNKKIFVILPAYNEEEVIGVVLDNLKSVIKTIPHLVWETVVIDDCSTDKTRLIALQKGATVLHHALNRGLGGALATGFTYARIHSGDVLVTMDSDGQHDPKDIKRLIKPILQGTADVVIGTRDKKEMPYDRKVLTWLGSILTFILFGFWCDDTQSGFRVFGKKAIGSVNIKTQKMEVSSEFFSEIKKSKLNVVQMPITVIYTDYSRKKGQSNLNSINILLRLLLRLAR